MVEVGVANFKKLGRSAGAADLWFEVAFDAVADVGESFFHALDMGGRMEFAAFPGEFIVEFGDVFQEVAVGRKKWGT